MTKTVFVDTWGWLALLFESDDWHDLASLHFIQLVNEGSQIFTSSAVIYEMAENARRRHHHQASVQLLDHVAAAVAADELQLIFVDQAKQQTAMEFYRTFSDQGVSFTDCLSFAIMRELGITTAFTGDWHFTLPGFNIIPGVRPKPEAGS